MQFDVSWGTDGVHILIFFQLESCLRGVFHELVAMVMFVVNAIEITEYCQERRWGGP